MKRYRLLLLGLFAALALTGCAPSGWAPSPTPEPTPASPPAETHSPQNGRAHV